MRALVARPRSVGKARGHDPAPQLAVRCKYPVIADEVKPGSGHQSGEFCEQIEGFEEEVCGAVGIGLFQRIAQLAFVGYG